LIGAAFCEPLSDSSSSLHAGMQPVPGLLRVSVEVVEVVDAPVSFDGWDQHVVVMDGEVVDAFPGDRGGVAGAGRGA
jgi:hypothetical protein